MGSWSVYCGISQIAITAGQECVFLPLKKNARGNSYLPYIPATLPIFGEYDDYGGIENIIKDDNTKFIEKHFKCKIDAFCTFFTRGCIRDDESDFPKKLGKIEEIKDWKFMFIDKKVYDFMSSFTGSGENGAGELEFGNPDILKLLGFKHNGEKINKKVEDSSRYNDEWELNGVKFYSDGTWLHHPKGAIYTFNGEYNALSDYVKISEDKKWVSEKSMWQLWEHLEDAKAKEQLLWIIGRERNEDLFGFSKEYTNILWDKLESLKEKGEEPDMQTEEGKKKYFLLMADAKKESELIPVKIEATYSKNFRKLGKLLCDLVTIRHNLHAMSGTFAPYILYLTPQCGEYKHHQVLLEKFAEINKSYIAEDEE